MSSFETPRTSSDNTLSQQEDILAEWMRGGPGAMRQLQLFFLHAPIGLSWREVDANGTPGRNVVNQRFCDLIGLTAEEASYIDNVRKITHPDDWARQAELTAEIYAGKRDSFVLEKRYQRRDGSVVMCELTVVVLRDPSTGRVTHHFAMLGDVSARHAAEQELRRSESRWRTYLKIASEILYAITPEGIYKFVSDAWTPKLGHEVNEVVGRTYTEFVHPEDIAMLREFIAETLELGVNPRGIEYRVHHKDGHWVWHATTGSAYTDRDGRRAFFGVGRDISIRRKAQEELKLALARREELEQIVNRSPSVVVLWLAEENWPVEYVSQSIRQFGYQPEDFTSRRLSFRGITHPDDRERVGAEVDAHAANQHREYSQEYRIVCADGSIRWVDDHTVVRFDAEGNVTHHEGLISDITLRKDAEDRERALRERDLRLAGEVQHQLRPHVFPDIGEVEIEALSQASLHIGGDYYDVLPVDERRWGFVIADVAGKGPAAALMMAACRATLRLCAAGEPSAASVVRRVNRALHADMPRGMFISLFYGILDLNTNRLTYVRAGHEPAILLRAGGGAPELLSAGGLALGFDDGPVFDAMLEETVLDLAAGDLLALYTDGITEAANAAGEEFGRDRMVTALAAQANVAAGVTRLPSDGFQSHRA
jgi:sigma-B regulation protein RsbU (phosphoserine phosphatase)